MTELLIVPSPTLVPLSTVVPVPTDGQPERYICPDPLDPVYEPFTIDPDRGGVTCKRCEPVGPFPFTVGVWQEVRCYTPDKCHAAWCGEEVCARGFGAVVATVPVIGKGHHADECCPDKGVGYDGIHGLGCGCNESWRCPGKPLTPEGWSTAGEHCECWSSGDVRGGYVCCRCGDGPTCGVDARRVGWHTPTSAVTWLDVPIPMERPTHYTEAAFVASLDDDRAGDLPAPFWWADLTVKADR